MNLSRRPDVERFLKSPDAGARAALIYGRDLGVVRDRGQQLARTIVKDPDDPFDVAILTEAEAQAKANQLLAQSVTPTLVQYEMAKRWNGQMPQVAGSAMPMIQLPKP